MLGRRMKYSDAFEHANQHLSGKVCVILNADMFLGEGVDAVLSKASDLFAITPTALSLTRHESRICNHREANIFKDEANNSYCECAFMKRGYAGSHDSFWFQSPISQSVVDQTLQIQSRWGAEHKVINALLSSNYRVLNPSRSV